MSELPVILAVTLSAKTFLHLVPVSPRSYVLFTLGITCPSEFMTNLATAAPLPPVKNSKPLVRCCMRTSKSSEDVVLKSINALEPSLIISILP